MSGEKAEKRSVKRRYKKYRHSGVRPGKKPGTYLIDFIDHNGIRHQKTYHGVESDAVKCRRAILVKVDRIKAGLELSPESASPALTFMQIWELFREDRLMKVSSGSLAPTTLERNKNAIEALFSCDKSLQGTPIDEITPADFEAFKIYRIEMGYSPVGVNTILRSLRTIFNFAVKKDLLEKSPFNDVVPIAGRQSDVRYLDDVELRKLQLTIEELNLEDEFQQDAADLTLFYLFTGARTSEALYPGFGWDCVKKTSLSFPKTKGNKSRNIPLIQTVDKILNRRRSIEGGPFGFTRDMVYNRIKYLLNKAGIENASTHTLRKTAGAWYYMATRDIFATSRFLGHSSVKVTEQHYAGLIQSLQVEYSNIFEKTILSRLQLGCNFEIKPDQSRQNRRHLRHKKSPNLSSETGALTGAGPTGIEPATSGLTGRRSNQTELRSLRT